jgi:hypothetical protein
LSRTPFLLAVVLVSLLGSPARAAQPSTYHPPRDRTAAYQWLDITLETAAREVERDGARPTILSRAMGIAMTAMYDAWAAYDDRAVGSRLGGRLRRPPAERTRANREKALAYATFRALLDLYPEDAAFLNGVMREEGYDPDDRSLDVRTPQGVGNTAAAALLAYRHHDGANQLGDEIGSDGTPYSDYTYYRPVNTPEKVVDPDRWQPIPFSDGKGGTVVPGFLTPQWYRVQTFALERSSQFRPGPPPLVGTEEMKKEVDENLRLNATLTPEQKALVEFMRDGPRSTGQSGHWLKFAQAVSTRDHNDLDRDVKLFFTVANVAMDAFIACWETKRYYDSSRPWTLVRWYYRGQKVEGWGGPGQGVVQLPAEEWHPYSPFTFVTPPFPGYISGHSTVSGASSKVLELFTGSDRFGEVEKRRAGALTEANFPCDQLQAHGRKKPVPPPPCDVALNMPTFSAAADMAGLSRVMGGYHIQADNLTGLAVGRKLAEYEWPRLRAYFEGTAPDPGAAVATELPAPLPVRSVSAHP